MSLSENLSLGMFLGCFYFFTISEADVLTVFLDKIQRVCGWAGAVIANAVGTGEGQGQ